MTKSAQITVEGWQWVTLNDEEHKVSYSATASMWYLPGNVSGPPEGECIITQISINSVEDSTGEHFHTPAILEGCRRLLNGGEIEERLWEAYHEVYYG